MSYALLIALVAATAACTGDDADPCAEDRCEGAQTRAELIDALDGFADPIAAYLRDAATGRGTLVGDYRTVMDAVGTSLGCDAASEASFVVLSNDAYTPKLILSRCADDAVAASQFFMALGGVDGHGGTDPQAVHMVAWDANAGRYRRYSGRATEHGELSINVEPRFCLGCHGGPEQLGTWTPLMNEMTSPWSGWNAEPGFRSQLFDDYLDPVVAASLVYREVTAPGRLRSAADLEPIVRAGIDRVTSARIKRRDATADVDEALALLRPLFCDESINYVSEIHGGGELRTSAFIDPALPGLFAAAGVTGAWRWASETSVFLPSGEPALTLMPVRGESTVQAELSLVTRGLLSAEQVLRVRALDWRQPVGSELRCERFRQGSERVRGQSLNATTNGELARAAYAEIMAGAADVVLATWAAQLEAHLAAALAPGMRATLAARRREVACALAPRFPTTPIFPDFECP